MISFKKVCEQYGVSAEYQCTEDNRYQLVVGNIYVGNPDYWCAQFAYLVGKYYPNSVLKKTIYSLEHKGYKMQFDIGTVFDMITDNITVKDSNA